MSKRTSTLKLLSSSLLLFSFLSAQAGVPPADPVKISGPPGACKGQSSVEFCVDPVAGATNYIWTIGNEMAGTSSTECIVLDFSNNFIGGSICVEAENLDGKSGKLCLGVALLTNKPGKPSDISGNEEVCAPSIQTYCINEIPETEYYDWTINGNGGNAPLTILSGAGTTCITVDVPAGYNGKQELKVQGVNCKGTGGDKKIKIKVLEVPKKPASITGPTHVCLSQLGFYSVKTSKDANGYSWSIDGGSFIAGGQGTENLAVDFVSSVATQVLISVQAENVCGLSAPSELLVNVNPACRVAAPVPVPGELPITYQQAFEFTAYPIPAKDKIYLRYEADENSRADIRLFDVTGKMFVVYETAVTTGTNEQSIDLTGLSPGIYFLRLAMNSEVNTKRIIIQ